LTPAGVHTGEFEVRPGDVVGLTVSIAKRLWGVPERWRLFTVEG